ncbi:MAG: response regulator [Thermodesulfobacteriota bacterium]
MKNFWFGTHPPEFDNRLILSIDDDPVIRKSICSYLEDCGFRVIQAENGLRGLELFDREKPDIVLLDLRMPGMNGFQVLEELTKRTTETPVIVISGTGEIQEVIDALRKGAWDYVTKPIHDMLILEHVISNALTKAGLLVENREYREHLEEQILQRTARLNERSKALEEANQRLETEMTERQAAEKERLYLATAIEQAADGILITEKNGTIRYLNPAFERMTGYSQQEAKGRSYKILKNKSYPESFYRNVWQEINAGRTWKGHMVSPREAAPPRELEVSISPVRDKDDNIISFVSVNRDVTQELQLEKQLIQAQKMEAIATLTGGIAHDFNNILSAIMGYTQLAMGRASLDEKMRGYCEKVIMAGNRARDLIGQILSFSRQSPQESKKVHIKFIVKEVMKLLKVTLPANIEIRLSISATRDAVLADPTQIHQVLMNLCTNAAYAMRMKGGALTVALKEVRLDREEATRKELNEGNYLRLTVADTGQGIPPEDIHKIFDPYFTTKGPGKGTGLGLSVTRNIIKKLCGSIGVESQPGRGTCFTVLFPQADTVMEEGASAKPEKLPVGNERILFIDDEEFLVDVGKELLEQLGYDVLAKTSSLDALELFLAAPRSFDLIITDHSMPKITGIELIKRVHLVRPDIPVILCSGFPETIPTEKLPELGVRELMVKPFTIADLALSVRRALDSTD